MNLIIRQAFALVACRLLGHKRLHSTPLAGWHNRDGMGVWHAGLYTPPCVRCGQREFLGTTIVEGCDVEGCCGPWACRDGNACDRAAIAKATGPAS